MPTEDGQPPLGNAKEWHWLPPTAEGKGGVVSKEIWESSPSGGGGGLELNTMPGWAGSSWYWLRYMDAHNSEEFVSEKAESYWQNVDLYIGGSEHATGHLLYARFWNKFLKDRGFITHDEPFKKLINQGMILGNSAFVYRFNWGIIYDKIEGVEFIDKIESFYITKSKYDKIIKGDLEEIEKTKNIYLSVLSTLFPDISSLNVVGKINLFPVHVDVSLVNTSDELNIEAFKNSRKEYKNAEFIFEDNDGRDSARAVRTYKVGREVEKMSKSKYNVVSPDDICVDYGADTLRLYEMFLGPLEQSKPWNTAGISGVFGFLKKLWKLYFDEHGLVVTSNPASKEALKSLHKTIKKVTEDIDAFSFNTSVSQFMICVNELTAMNCHERSILEPLTVLISPYAPHIAEELWEKLGHQNSISEVPFPKYNPDYLVESSKEYPVSFNGKMRFTIELPLDLKPNEIEEIILKDERTIKQLDGNIPKKVIIVPGKVINLVL